MFSTGFKLWRRQRAMCKSSLVRRRTFCSMASKVPDGEISHVPVLMNEVLEFFRGQRYEVSGTTGSCRSFFQDKFSF